MSSLVFLTCHLSGTGHLVRTLALARAGAQRGHDVAVITGGRVLEHLDTSGVTLHQLPPVGVHGLEFTHLRAPDGSLVSDAYMAERRETLLALLAQHTPDVLITELYPFGRRVLTDEFLGAIDAVRAARPGAVVFSSVRDIPEPKPKRLTETATHLLKRYDGVLVHGDARFLPLSTTWPLPDDVMGMIHHVGYVGAGRVPQAVPRRRDVLVSVGGGALGRRLLDCAAAAASQSTLSWHLLVGGADAEEAAKALRRAHPATNLKIEPPRADYLDLLTSAGCSISLAGYNTSVELAACRTPAILVPSEEAEETEQLIRARRLAEAPGIELMRSAGLTPKALARAADALATGPERPAIALAGDDGAMAIETLERALAVKPQ